MLHNKTYDPAEVGINQEVTLFYAYPIHMGSASKHSLDLESTFPKSETLKKFRLRSFIDPGIPLINQPNFKILKAHFPNR